MTWTANEFGIANPLFDVAALTRTMESGVFPDIKKCRCVLARGKCCRHWRDFGIGRGDGHDVHIGRVVKLRLTQWV